MMSIIFTGELIASVATRERHSFLKTSTISTAHTFRLLPFEHLHHSFRYTRSPSLPSPSSSSPTITTTITTGTVLSQASCGYEAVYFKEHWDRFFRHCYVQVYFDVAISSRKRIASLNKETYLLMINGIPSNGTFRTFIQAIDLCHIFLI